MAKIDLPESPEERRSLLDQLASRHGMLSKEDLKLHDALAKQVAQDEDHPDKEQ